MNTPPLIYLAGPGVFRPDAQLYGEVAKLGTVQQVYDREERCMVAITIEHIVDGQFAYKLYGNIKSP